MEATENKQLSPLKLNVKRTMIIGFAFFGILLLWQVYDSWCPKFLEQLFMEALHKENNEEVKSKEIVKPEPNENEHYNIENKPTFQRNIKNAIIFDGSISPLW